MFPKLVNWSHAMSHVDSRHIDRKTIVCSGPILYFLFWPHIVFPPACFISFPLIIAVAASQYSSIRLAFPRLIAVLSYCFLGFGFECCVCCGLYES